MVDNLKASASCKQSKPRAAARAKAQRNEPRISLYAEVTAQIIAELEAGRFPWVQPWNASAASVGLPRNAISGRA